MGLEERRRRAPGPVHCQGLRRRRHLPQARVQRQPQQLGADRRRLRYTRIHTHTHRHGEREQRSPGPDDVSESSLSHSSEAESLDVQPHTLLILDARSYAAAVANRAKGGGCECPGTDLKQPSLPPLVGLTSDLWSPVILLQTTTQTVRWCSWAWPTSTPFARASSRCASSALKSLIQPSRFLLFFFFFLYKHFI